MLCTGSIMAQRMDEQIEAGEVMYEDYCKRQEKAAKLLDVFGCSEIGQDKDGKVTITLNQTRPSYQPDIKHFLETI